MCRRAVSEAVCIINLCTSLLFTEYELLRKYMNFSENNQPLDQKNSTNFTDVIAVDFRRGRILFSGLGCESLFCSLSSVRYHLVVSLSTRYLLSCPQK